MRWLPTDMKKTISTPSPAHWCEVAYDLGKIRRAVPNEWSADYFAKTNERVPLLCALPVQTRR